MATGIKHRSGGQTEVAATARAPLCLQKRRLAWTELGPPFASRGEAVKCGNRSRRGIADEIETATDVNAPPARLELSCFCHPLTQTNGGRGLYQAAPDTYPAQWPLV